MDLSTLDIPTLASTKLAALFAGHDEDQVVVALVCGGFGMLMLLLVISALREAAAMKRWPVAKGRVQSSAVEEYLADAGSGSFGGAHARMVLYRPVEVYEYEVAGRTYQSNRIAQSRGSTGSAHFCREDRAALSLRKHSQRAFQSQTSW